MATCSSSSTAESDASGIKLYKFECGHFEFSDLKNFGDEGENDGRSGEMVVTCFLIRHPKGDLLWDAGLPDSFNDLPEGIVENGTRVTVPKTPESQILDLNLALEEIDFLRLLILI